MLWIRQSSSSKIALQHTLDSSGSSIRESGDDEQKRAILGGITNMVWFYVIDNEIKTSKRLVNKWSNKPHFNLKSEAEGLLATLNLALPEERPFLERRIISTEREIEKYRFKFTRKDIEKHKDNLKKLITYRQVAKSFREYTGQLADQYLSKSEYEAFTAILEHIKRLQSTFDSASSRKSRRRKKNRQRANKSNEYQFMNLSIRRK